MRAAVTLTTPTAERRDEFLAAMRASRSLHRPWLKPPLTRREYDNYLSRLELDRFEGFLVCRRDDDAIVGFFNLGEIIRGNLQSAFLGYGAVAEFAGSGYMTAGLRLVIRRAFVTLRLHRLEANIQPGNRASIALVSRCGFEREGFSPLYLKVGGRWRDHERWAILADGQR
jgi:ribosomal-protein-alanine N-acetyltransferase